MDRLPSEGTHTQNIPEQVCGAEAGGKQPGLEGDRAFQPTLLTLESTVSFRLGRTGGRDHELWS